VSSQVKRFVAAALVRVEDGERGLVDGDIAAATAVRRLLAAPFDDATQRAVATDGLVLASVDRSERVDIATDDPRLDHVARLAVIAGRLEARGDGDDGFAVEAAGALVEDDAERSARNVSAVGNHGSAPNRKERFAEGPHIGSVARPGPDLRAAAEH
jgi:hypothetical protein